ncbi:hypothetical protein AAY473_008807 [Plecturocebus cupreus]
MARFSPSFPITIPLWREDLTLLPMLEDSDGIIAHCSLNLLGSNHPSASATRIARTTEMSSRYNAHLELLASNDPLASVSQSAGITDCVTGPFSAQENSLFWSKLTSTTGRRTVSSEDVTIMLFEQGKGGAPRVLLQRPKLQLQTQASWVGLQLPKLQLWIQASLCSYGRARNRQDLPSQVQLQLPSQVQELGVSTACTLGSLGRAPHYPCWFGGISSCSLTSFPSWCQLISGRGFGAKPLGLEWQREAEFWVEGGGSSIRPHLQAREGLKAGDWADDLADQSGDSWCLLPQPMAAHGPVGKYFFPSEVYKSPGLTQSKAEDGQRTKRAERGRDWTTSCREEHPLC